MKARITHLKAPWPSGAVVGTLVAFAAGSVPTWAVGKCRPDDCEEEPEHIITPPFDGANAGSHADPLAALRHEAQAFIDRQRAEFEQHAAEMQARLDAQATELEQLRTAKDDAEARATSLQAKLDAADTGEGKFAAALQEAEQQAAAESKAKGKK